MLALTLVDALLHSELLASPRAVAEAQQLLGSTLDTLAAEDLQDNNVPQNCRDRARKILQVLTARLPSTQTNNS